MISVTFTSDIEHITCNTHVYQWDMKRTLEIKGLTFDDTPVVHFANKMSKSAIVVEPTIANGTLVADIPNSLLCEPHHIIAYVYSLDDNQCKTVKTVFIPLEKRPKPDDFVFEGNEGIVALAEINAKVDALIVSTNAHYDAYIQAKNVELNGFMTDKTTQINNFIASQNADREAYQNSLNQQMSDFQANVGSSHNHHNLYYTESEIDTKLSEKANADEIAQTMANALTGVAKVVTGTYTGNDATSKAFTVSGTPIFISVIRHNLSQTYHAFAIKGNTQTMAVNYNNTASVSWSTNEVTLTNTAGNSGLMSFNTSGQVYSYMIIYE